MHLSLTRYIFRARFADLSFLFKKMMSFGPWQHHLYTTYCYRALMGALTTVTNALAMYAGYPEITRTVSSDPIPRHYAAPL